MGDSSFSQVPHVTMIFGTRELVREFFDPELPLGTKKIT